jgi:hypothetical protein
MVIVQSAKMVIQHMQMLNQQITPMGRSPQQSAHGGQGRIVGLTALEFAFAADALAHIVDRRQGHGRRRNRGCALRFLHGSSIETYAHRNGFVQTKKPRTRNDCVSGA